MENDLDKLILSSLLDSFTEPVLSIDRNYKCTFFNAASARLLKAMRVLI